jgi:hypothetical protein
MFDDISDSVGAIFDPVFEHTLGFYEASFPSDPFDLLPKLWYRVDSNRGQHPV